MAHIDDGKFVALNVSGKKVEIYYHEIGTEDQNAIIFMQTGGAGTTAHMCWYLNLEAFADAGYHVYAPDAPGFGRSKLASGETGPVNALDFLLAFMDEMGISQAHLIGNSMGAETGIRFEAAHPDRVRSLILSGGDPRLDTDEVRSIAPTLGSTPRMNFVREMLSKSELGFDDMQRATADFFYNRGHAAVEDVTRMRLDTLRDPELLERVKEDAIGQVQRGRTNRDSSHLAKVRAPTYLLHGRDEKWFFTDDTAPALIDAAVKVAFVIPDCRCTLLPYCGHWPQLEQADTYNALVLDFLRQHETG